MIPFRVIIEILQINKKARSYTAWVVETLQPYKGKIGSPLSLPTLVLDLTCTTLYSSILPYGGGGDWLHKI
jgi:hypothetical protein